MTNKFEEMKVLVDIDFIWCKQEGNKGLDKIHRIICDRINQLNSTHKTEYDN